MLDDLKLSWVTEFIKNFLGQWPCQVNMSTNQEAELHPLALAGSWPTTTHGFGQVYIFIYNKHWYLRYSISLMIRKEMVLETLVYSPFNHLMQLLAWGSFIEFICYLFAFLPNRHVKQKVVAVTQQMASLSWPLPHPPLHFYFQT
jgi:hypothetical protein